MQRSRSIPLEFSTFVAALALHKELLQIAFSS